MSYVCKSYKVIERSALSEGIYSYLLSCPDVAELAKAGQFVHIRVDGFTLRRPISICEIDKKLGTIRIVFETRGNGTQKLATTKANDYIDMIAPLGNGFSLPSSLSADQRIVVVGGGIGVPPLLGAAKQYGEQTTAILGFRSFNREILMNDFQNAVDKVEVCTDDGSYGAPRLVTVPLAEELAKGQVALVLACGPTPMLSAVAEMCKKQNIPCQVSMEERMGCGVGACACCVCKVQRDDKVQMLGVCKAGPVFDGAEVIV